MNDTATETGLYARVQHFYAHQMQALDGGRFEEYALTFTETGTFQHSPSVEPVRGRAAIVAELVRFHERFAEAPVQRRHWFNHIALTPRPDGSVRSTVYTLVLTVRPGRREPEIAPSCVVHDVLETDGDGIRTRSRSITHDHLG